MSLLVQSRLGMDQLTPYSEGAGITTTTGSEVAKGTTDNGNTLAPYHALCYIMYAGKVL